MENVVETKPNCRVAMFQDYKGANDAHDYRGILHSFSFKSAVLESRDNKLTLSFRYYDEPVVMVLDNEPRIENGLLVFEIETHPSVVTTLAISFTGLCP